MDTITQNYMASPYTINSNNNSINLILNNIRPRANGCLSSDIKSISSQLGQNNGNNNNNNNHNNNQQHQYNVGIRNIPPTSSVQGSITTTTSPPIRNSNSILGTLRSNYQKNPLFISNLINVNNANNENCNNNNNNNNNCNNINNNNNNNNNSNDGSEIKRGAKILNGRYLIINQLNGSSLHNCMDIKTGEMLLCKAIGNSYSKIVSAYFRMDECEHIKPLHKLLQASDVTYLLLPPSEYGDLHSFVRERKRLREPEARYLFRQICKTVKECHEQGIVLRDLKLRKFVFSNKERTHLKFESLEDAVVLDDYDNDILKEKIGCPAYVAPEILKPNSDFSGKAADLWSLGVILYTMLVGRYPFNDPEHSSLFAKISRCTFTIPDFVSPKARCLIKSLLQKVPKNRLISDDLLDHQWLHEDPMIKLIGGNSIYDDYYNLNGIRNIGSFALAAATSNYELSQDDHRVPEMNTVDIT